MSAETKQSDSLAKSETNGMGNGRFIWLARVGWVCIFLLVASMFVVNLPHVYRDTLDEWQVGEAIPTALQIFPSRGAFVSFIIALRLSTLTVFVGTALFLAWQKWDNWFVLFTSATLLLMSYMFGMQFNVDLIRYPRWLEQLFPAIGNTVPILIVFCMLLLFYLFPNGRFVPRWFALLLLPALLVMIDVFSKLYNPLLDSVLDGLLTNLFLDGENWWTLFMLLLLGTAVVGLISQLVRYRFVSSPEQRQQTKWVLLGLSSIIASPLFLWFTLDAFNIGNEATRHFISLILETIVPTLLPITLAISITRYKLWEVDWWINRALLYGVLTAVIMLIYGFSVGLAGVLLPAATNWFVPALALAVVVLLVRPIYGRLQTWVDQKLPVPHLQETNPQTAESPPAFVIIRLAQAAWVILLVYAMWQTVASLLSFEQLTQQMLREWLVQESTRGLSANVTENIVRIVVVNGIWTLIISMATAGLIFWRKRNERMALYAAFLLLIAPFGVSVGNSNPTAIEEALSFLGLAVLLFFPFIFPTGHFVPRSWKWRSILLLTLFVLPLPLFAIVRFAQPDASLDEQGYFTFVFLLTAVLLAGMVSQVYRYRYLSNRVQRRQTRWLLVAFGVQFVWFGWVVFWLSTPGNPLLPESTMALIALLGALITSTLLPLSIAVAILYDRLWQIDVVLNRTLVFGGLTVLVIFLYILVVGILGTLFQSGNNLLLSVLATGLIAVLFDPLRRRLQRTVNRLMYGQRDDPFAVMSKLGRQLENTAVPEETLSALTQTIAQALKLPYVAIVTNENEVVAHAGEPPTYAPQTFALIYQAQAIGHLAVAQRTTKEPFTADEERLLRNVARQAGTAVYVAHLTDQLQRSRKRLVSTREEERRRLRRDLHDGLGPQMASLTIKVGAAQNLLRTDPEKTETLLAEMQTESQTAVQEIRRVVDGLRPAALDQLGLLSALQQFAASQGDGRTKIAVTSPAQLPLLPAAVEVAAYRIVTEAVTNVLRHAQAENCAVHLFVENDLILEIKDDGHGLPIDSQAGVGLTSMHTRADELGGSLKVVSGENGVLVTAVLPLNI